MDSLVRDVFRLFGNRVDCHLGWHGKWVLKRQPLTASLVQQALDGHYHLGVQAVSGTGTSRWTCLDVDEDGQLQQLLKLAQSLPAESRLFERSRRGGHLWFFHRSIPWEQAHTEGLRLTGSVGLDSIEVYPKHGGLHAVKLPGTVHPKSGRVYPVIDPDSGEVLEIAAILPRLGATYEVKTALVQGGSPTAKRAGAPHQFDQLVQALLPLTEITVYAPDRASGKCPWHDDTEPSLYIKGRRFHCLACGVWGDVADVQRFVVSGVRPPT